MKTERRRKFTTSADGVERTTVRLEVRLDRDELASCERAAARDGLSLHEYLYWLLSEGLESIAGDPDEEGDGADDEDAE